MCPACIAGMALMAGSVSTGGIAALAVRMVRSPKTESKTEPKNNSNVTERRNDNGNNDGKHDDQQD